MKKAKNFFIKLFYKIGKNRYLLVLVFALFWMTFWDGNNFIYQYQSAQLKNELEAKKAYLKKQIEEIKKDKAYIEGGPKNLEKYAREQYLMKKPGEILFVIEE